MNIRVAQRGRDRTTGTHRGIRTVIAVLGGATLVALAGSVLTASPAAAHATISKASPADQAHLATAPTEVTIEFSEAVNPAAGGMTVLAQDRSEVQDAVDQPAPNQLRATLKPGLGHGTYVTTYRIISEDGHPISGSLIFGVGEVHLADVSDLAVESDATMDALSKVGQFVVYLGALATAGLAFFLTSLYEPCPSGGTANDRERRRLARFARIGAGLAVVGMAVVLVAQTAQATGEGAGAVFDLEKVSTVLDLGLGRQDAGLLAGLVLCLVALAMARGTAAKVVAAVGGVLASASFVLWGHAIEGANTWLTVPADAIHLVVAAVWFGGLAGLFAVLRSRSTAGLVPAPATTAATAPAARTGESATTGDDAGAEASLSSTGGGTATAVLDDPDPVDGGASVVLGGSGDGPGTGGGGGAAGGSDLAATVVCVRRFSAAAFVSLLALSAAGIAVGLVEMGGLGTLFSSTYGRLLLAKLVVVAAVAAVAGYNRFYLLPWLLTDDRSAAEVDEDRQRSGWRTLLSTVRFEALTIVVVLALTAVLVNTTPGPGEAAMRPSEPLHQTQQIADGQAMLHVTPNRPGTNAIMLEVTTPDGKPLDVLEAQVELTLESAGVGPITRTLEKMGAGHFMLNDTRDLSLAGDWQIDVVLRVDEFDETRLTFKDTIS